jgi:hypothetical protein
VTVIEVTFIAAKLVRQPHAKNLNVRPDNDTNLLLKDAPIMPIARLLIVIGNKKKPKQKR